VNRRRRNRELEVRVMFEPSRFTQHYLGVAYERAVPTKSRRTRGTTHKQERNNRKVACRAGGGL